MSSRSSSSVRRLAALLAGLLVAALLPSAAAAHHTPDPGSVALVGDLQEELGCPGDWQPDCAATELLLDEQDDLWRATFTVPAGDWSWKVALDDAWDENYGDGAVAGGDNISLSLVEATEVTFLYDHDSHWPTDTARTRLATAAGSFQSELGCDDDWQPWCLRSWLQDLDGDGVQTFTTDAIPAGSHEFKVALDEAWDIAHPADNVAFDVPSDGTAVTISFDTATQAVAVEVESGDDGGDGGDGDLPDLADFPAAPSDEELALGSLRDDLDDEVFYFVLPDRFHNGDPTNDCGDHAGECSLDAALEHGFDPTDTGFYHGGDLAGLLDKLDYIEGLGITAIWMAPMFKNRPVQGPLGGESAGYHGYWTIDYTQMDPHFGSNAELTALIDAAHARDIKVFFDIVTNHTADVIQYEGGDTTYVPKSDVPYVDADGQVFDDRDFAGTADFPALDPAISFPYVPTFATPEDVTVKVPSWLNDPTLYHNRGDSRFAGENSLYGDFVQLDDLFTEHPAVVDGMVDIFEYWTSEFDVDGFRIDTVKHVNIEFWQQWVPQILDHTTNTVGNDDFFMFGEVFTPDPAFLSIFTTTTPMQAVLDFGFQGSATGFANSAPTSRLADFFASDDWYIDADSNAYSLPTFLGNHDMGRIGTFISGANSGAPESELLARDVLAHALMFAARGMPVVYSGDEQGFTGDGGDQASRQDMDPTLTEAYLDDDLLGTDATHADDNFDTTHPLYTTIGELSDLTRAHEALRSGAQLPRYAQGSAGMFAFSRVLRDELVEYLVVANNATGPAQASFATATPGATFAPVWSSTGGVGELAAAADGSVDVELPGLTLAVYRADATMPTGDTAPAVTLGGVDRFDVEQDGQEQHGLLLSAELDTDAFAEVTFAVSVDGRDWEVAGTDDNAPWTVRHRTEAEGGTPVAVKAVVRDAAGNLSSAITTAFVPAAPGGGGGGGGGGTCDTSTAVVHYNRPDGAYDDWTLWSFFDIDEPFMDSATWPDGLQWDGEDDFGVFRTLDLQPGAQQVGAIVVSSDQVKDGTDDDRVFDPRVSPEVWINAGDPVTYTSQAAAQGHVRIGYQRPDGDYGTWPSDDFTQFWGLHLWGDALADGVATEWTAPRPPDGTDAYGVYWEVPVDDVAADLNFIVHRGDDKDPGPDQSVVPSDDGSIWIQSGDEEIHASEASATDTVVLHYQRPDGDYGDWTSTDFTDFWGVHTWTGADPPNPTWQQPYLGTGVDRWGAVYEIPVEDGADGLNYILHRGDEKDLPDDQFLDLEAYGHEVWIESGRVRDDGQAAYVLPLAGCGPAGGEGGSLAFAAAHWLTPDTIAWDAPADGAATYTLHTAPDGGLTLVDGGVVDGGDATELAWVSDTLPADLAAAYPHLSGLDVLRVPDGLDVAALLTGQLAVSSVVDDVRTDATGLQLPGVLDALYATDTPLGVTWDGDVPTIAVWAPTAKDVALRTYAGDGQDADAPDQVLTMTRDDATGVWSVTGEPAWDRAYYLFEVEVYVPSTGAVETNLVTDPYSLSLAADSAKSQVVDLSDPDLAPAGWDGVATTAPATPEQIDVYELHVRDFSISDETVPEELRGTYAAFTLDDTDGAEHLRSLAEAGVTSVHLLPTYDLGSIPEVDQLEPDTAPYDDLEGFPADSEVPQERVAAVAAEDGFNWGYDPFHYTTPEGSYSTDPAGTTRIVEYRGMVQALNGRGLGVIQDVVYNHTFEAGQGEKSVLDRIVPGYYHRLLEDGTVATSTCCPNTAPEHEMMGRLVVDSIVTWAREYRIDGFRFDLMGHHPKQNLLDVRAALDGLTLADDGVDGASIYVYGEGWNFGEVGNDARFEQATQANMAGTGIGTFNDRLRDAVRGGGPFDGDQAQNQGFASGLWTDPNDRNDGGDDERAALLYAADRIRIGLAGNLADYTFVDRNGVTTTGAALDDTGYTADPQENILYVAAHDNETLYDSNVFKLPTDASMDTRVRMQALGLSSVVYGQGVTFLHAGTELLRSKSLDRNSFNSGDHFNELDWSSTGNNFGVGLPPAPDNADAWDQMRPLLADPALAADGEAIRDSYARVREHLLVQESSELFALTTAEQVQDKVRYLNTGTDQVPGLVVMHLDDTVGDDVDPDRERLVVLFNGSDEPVEFTVEALEGAGVALHPVLAGSDDAVVAGAGFDAATGTFTVPARTTSVFEEASVLSLDGLVDVRRRFIIEGTGGVAVVVRSSGTFDATTIDPATIRFGPDGAAPTRCRLADMDRDGLLDRYCVFDVADTGLRAEMTTAELVASTYDGQRVAGSDDVWVKPAGRRFV